LRKSWSRRTAVKRLALLALAGVAGLCLMAGALRAQEKEGEGVRRDKNGRPVLPDSTPISGRNIVDPGFLVDIRDIDVKQSPAGPTFTLTGVSKFPDGTHATVAIKFHEADLPNANSFVTIQDNKFEITWEAPKLWAGKKFFPGHYEFEVEVRYDLQSRKMKAAIDKDMGANAQGRHYRNKYVTVGTKEEIEREENKFRDYYVGAINNAFGLYSKLQSSYIDAGARWRKKFRKLDKDKKPQKDPKNAEIYLVDEKAFKDYLKDSKNKFYDKKGEFQRQEWRKWLDDDWRKEWKKVFDSHQRMKGDYAAVPWPNQYVQFGIVLKMMMKKSAEDSIKIYKWDGQAPDKKDLELTEYDAVNPGEWPDPRDIEKTVMEIKNKLRLVPYLEKKAQEEDKDKGKKKSSKKDSK
jgi:hypothetical protein